MSEQVNEVQGFANASTDAPEAVGGSYLESLQAQLVQVIYGASDGMHPVAGHNVATVRQTLAEAYNIPADADAYLRGSNTPLEADYVLRPGESVQFVKQAGVKG